MVGVPTSGSHIYVCCCAEYQPDGADPISSSAVAISNGTVYTPSGKAFPFPVPRALDISEIPGIVKSYADGARNSLAAGKTLPDEVLGSWRSLPCNDVGTNYLSFLEEQVLFGQDSRAWRSMAQTATSSISS